MYCFHTGLGPLGAKDLIIDSNLLVITAWGNVPLLTRDPDYYRNYFNAGYDGGEQMPRFMAAVAYDMGYRKAIIMVNDFELGHDNATRFADIFEQLGGEVVQQVFTPLGCLDFTPYFLTVDIDKADFIYNFYWGGSAISWFTQYIDAGLKERIPFLTWGILDDDTLDNIVAAGYGDEAVGIKHGLFYTRNIDSPANNRMNASMLEMYGRSYADFGFLNGYDSARLAMLAIEAVNGDTSDLDGMIDFLENVEYVSARGPVSYGPMHILTQPGYVLQVVKEDGNYVNKVAEDYGEISMYWLPESLR